MYKDRLVINFHEHPGNPDLMRDCEAMGVDAAVLLPVGRDASLEAIDLAKKNPKRFILFHWIDFGRPISEELELLYRSVELHHIKGIKFQPMDQHMFPDDRRIYPFYEACRELGLVATWHAGIVNLPFKYELGMPMLSKYCDPAAFDEVAFDFPELRICIAHLGGNFMYTALVLAEKHENIFLDTAFLGFTAARLFPPSSPFAMIAHAVRTAGAGKILYGGEGVTPGDVDEADISAEAKEKVLGLNAKRLLGI